MKTFSMDRVKELRMGSLPIVVSAIAAACLGQTAWAQQGPPPPGSQDGIQRPLIRAITGGPPVPEIGQRMLMLHALRQIVEMNITRSDIDAALPVLQKLQDSETKLAADSNVLIDNEMKELLAVKPGEQLPDPGDSGLRKALSDYDDGQQTQLAALTTAIGPEKANALSQLAGLTGNNNQYGNGGGQGNWRSGPQENGQGGQGNFGGPPRQGGQGGQDGFGGPPQQNGQGNFGGPPQQNGQGGFGGPPQDGQGNGQDGQDGQGGGQGQGNGQFRPRRFPNRQGPPEPQVAPHISLSDLISLLNKRKAALGS